jgi:hypothetical protein
MSSASRCGLASSLAGPDARFLRSSDVIRPCASRGPRLGSPSEIVGGVEVGVSRTSRLLPVFRRARHAPSVGGERGFKDPTRRWRRSSAIVSTTCARPPKDSGLDYTDGDGTSSVAERWPRCVRRPGVIRAAYATASDSGALGPSTSAERTAAAISTVSDGGSLPPPPPTRPPILFISPKGPTVKLTHASPPAPFLFWPPPPPPPRRRRGGGGRPPARGVRSRRAADVRRPCVLDGK